MDKHLALTSTTVLAARRAGLRAGQDNVVEVLLRVQAPDAPAGDAAQRLPQAVALVIDRSGSMAGRPLAEARRCATYVTSKLRPSDLVSVVQFDSRVQRLLPATALGDGAAVRTAVAAIHSGGQTNLHGGWLEGADALSGLPHAALRRVVLLSDGCANVGLTDGDAILAQCAAMAAHGITTSTYGLGNNFNEALMVAMARSGAGNSYYGDTADDLMDPFQQEFDLLANLCLVNLELSMKAPDGVEFEILNALPSVGQGWRLPDLAWGAEAWALLRVKVPAGALPAIGGRLRLLELSVKAQGVQGQDLQLERASLALPVFSPASYDALPDDELVMRRLLELTAATVMDRMYTAAMAADWAMVEKLLADAKAQFAGHAWVEGMLNAMTEIARGREQQRMVKEAHYSSSKLRTRLAPKFEDADPMQAAQEPAFLRRKPLQGKDDA